MDRVFVVNRHELPIELLPQGRGYYLAVCPIWPKCYAQGRDFESAISEITLVAKTLIEIYDEEGKKVPLQTSRVKNSEDKIAVDISLFVTKET